MSNTPPEETTDPVGAALRYRNVLFLGGLGLLAFVVLTSVLIRVGHIDHPARPTMLTVILLVVALGDVALVLVIVDPSRALARLGAQYEQRGRDLVWAGTVLACLCAAFAAAPVLYGFILFMMSGEVWRILVFIPMTVAIFAISWRGTRRALEALAGSNVS